MYLVFDLSGEGNPAYPSYYLHREFDLWSAHYGIPYKTKYHKDKLRLILANDNEYHFFMLTWNPDANIPRQWVGFEVVDPPKH
jgi:hypothetical protein